MFSDNYYAHYCSDPCCSTTGLVSDNTMCDSMLNYDNEFQQQLASGGDGFDSQHQDAEMDLLMKTLEENPDFFDSTSFLVSSSSMSLQGCYHEQEFKMNQQHQQHQPQVFNGNEFFQPCTTSQTPVISDDTPPHGVTTPAQFKEFSLATQLPILNGYNTVFTSTADTTENVTNFSNFPSLEQYSAEYFFTTPPNTPPNMLLLTAPVAVPAMQSLNRSNRTSEPDRTPTIRKLLQQKRKRITAVPCHVNSVCSTCQTRTTSLWRRNHFGEIECNACNLYFRKNNCKRPVTLRKDEIMKRKRKPRVNSNNPVQNSITRTTPVDIKPNIATLNSSLFI